MGDPVTREATQRMLAIARRAAANAGQVLMRHLGQGVVTDRGEEACDRVRQPQSWGLD